MVSRAKCTLQSARKNQRGVARGSHIVNCGVSPKKELAGPRKVHARSARNPGKVHDRAGSIASDDARSTLDEHELAHPYERGCTRSCRVAQHQVIEVRNVNGLFFEILIFQNCCQQSESVRALCFDPPQQLVPAWKTSVHFDVTRTQEHNFACTLSRFSKCPRFAFKTTT